MAVDRHLSESSLSALARVGAPPSPAAARHLQHCPQCKAELELRQELAGIVAVGPSECPDDEQLVRWSDGSLEAPARASLDSHLLSCARCALILEDSWQAPARFRRRPPVTLNSVAARTSAAPSSTRAGVVDRLLGLAARLRELVAYEMPLPVALVARGAGAAAGGDAVRSAVEHYAAGRYREAAAGFVAAREAGEVPRTVGPLLGACWLQLEDGAKAAAEFERLAAAESDLGTHNWYWAQALLIDGRGDEALVQLKRAARKPGPQRAAAKALARRLGAMLDP